MNERKSRHGKGQGFGRMARWGQCAAGDERKGKGRGSCSGAGHEGHGAGRGLEAGQCSRKRACADSRVEAAEAAAYTRPEAESAQEAGQDVSGS